MKTTKCLIILGMSLILVISLLAGACAPAAPTGDEGAAEIAKLEDELADEKANVKSLEGDIDDLEDDIAALQEPAKVYRWEPATWAGAGAPWDFLVYMAEYLNETSNGRIVMTPSQPGSVCPVEEQIEAVAAGTTQAMMPTPSYYGGKFTLAAVYNAGIGIDTSEDLQIAYEVFENGRMRDLYWEALSDLYNVETAGNRYAPCPAVAVSSVPIVDSSTYEGMIFRCGDDHISGPLATLGASTAWVPWSEIYTAVSTGVVDAAIAGTAYDMLTMGFQDVAPYWLKSPAMCTVANEQFVINADVWNEMPDDLKELVDMAMRASMNINNAESMIFIDESWATLADAGVEIIEWDANSQKAWLDARMGWLLAYEDDPGAMEFIDLMKKYWKLKGYL
ncbi:TRAP transporter substrate-binding protein DctP [Chloroflexota bacterium]